MKDFFKMTGATLVGLILFSIVSGFLSIVMLMALVSVENTDTKLKENSVFKLNLNGTLVERSQSDDMEAFMRAINENVGTIALDDLRSSLRKAEKSSEINALYLNCGILSASPASLQELRSMLQRFKTNSGKPVYAYADSYTQGTYWLASVADSIFLNPQGMVMLTGMQMQTMFMKSALEKMHVEMQIFKVGTFKSAVEPYILDEMSEPNRKQMSRIADSLWTALSSDVVASRGVKLEDLNQFVNEGAMFDEVERVIQLGLVDRLLYRDEMEALIERDVDHAKYVTLSKMKRLPNNDSYSGNKVAVLYATGDIDGGSERSMKSSNIVKELNKLADNDDVMAVVLRVNSPGGSAYGSDQMWHAAKMLREKKPLIVSMSDYAASGGYYMSCIADTIVAQPTTLTGSIGIFGMFPNVGGLLDKVGVNFDGVKTHEFADFGSIDRPCTEAERAVMQRYINRGYENFVGKCAAGRGVAVDSIKAIAEGRVWLGGDALDNGLVDVLGGLDEAVAIAANKAGLTDNYQVKEYPVKKDFMTSLIEEMQTEVETRSIKSKLGIYAPMYEQYVRLINLQGIQALMPYTVEF